MEDTISGVSTAEYPKMSRQQTHKSTGRSTKESRHGQMLRNAD